MTHHETDYTELMGEADEVDIFFLVDDPDGGEPWFLRVCGGPDAWMEEVH